MTDRELLAARLAFIETCVRQLRTLSNPAAIESDIRELRFAEHTLQVAIQAALDVASHIVSDDRLGEPRTNRDLFDLISARGWIPAPLCERLRDMAGFRNILVHGYAEVNPRIVRNVVEQHLGELDAFVAAVRERLA